MTKKTFEQVERAKFLQVLALLIGIVVILFLVINYSFYSLRKKEHLQSINNLIDGTLKAHQGQLATELFLNQSMAYQLRAESLLRSFREYLNDPKICIYNNSNQMIIPNTQLCRHLFKSPSNSNEWGVLNENQVSAVFSIQDGAVIVGKMGIIYRDSFGINFVLKNYRTEILFVLGSFLALVLVLLFTLNQYMKKIFLRLRDTERVDAFNHIATQVAHDIRSPLAVLDFAVTKAVGLSKEKEILFKQAVTRVRDIANHLLEKNKKGALLVNNKEIKAELLSSLIDPLITEKRYQYANRLDIEFEMEQTEESYGLFAKVEVEGFKRVLSNLIDNSVEAIEKNGRIFISTLQLDYQVLVKIQDNGKGIAAELLSKVLEPGESFGKVSGFGLGLPYTKEMVEKWSGELRIESRLNKGTTVILAFPRETPPQWFVQELKIAPRLKILVLDDDSSIHSIWSRRISEQCLSHHQLEVLNFTAAKEFKEKVNKLREENAKFLCLMDHDLINQKQTGLDLIRELNLKDKSILVTSRFEEQALVDSCHELEIKILPKGLAGFIPIKFESDLFRKPDLVLIDDSDMVHNLWKLAAEDSGKAVLTLKNESELKAYSVDLTTPIFVDKNISEEFSGFDVALSLHEQGYTNLYIATGELLADVDPQLPFLRGVIGKEFPLKEIG
ncbi:MAG: sensor histidine kinase [Deltaproteobacteria bacterium]|nr:sensor histidine kinase [Deltaproteobacteria bacterium]